MRKTLLAIAIFAIILFAFGCSKKKEAETPKDPIKIGAVLSVSGPAAKLGGPEKNTVLMIAEQINAAGGINGRPVEIIVEDDQGVEENTINAIQKLINKDNVVAIVGPTRSGNGIAAAPVCEASMVPMVSCAAAWVQLFPGKDTTKPMFKFVFKSPQNDSDCALKIFGDCKAKGYTNVAIITGTDGFGAAGRGELLKVAPDFGIKIIADETYPQDATDLTPILTKIKPKKPQAIINWSIVPAQGLVAAQLKQLKMNMQLYQSHGFGNKQYITPEAEGVLFPASRLLVAGEIDSTFVQYNAITKFKSDYEAKYGEDVSSFAGHAYDALWLVIEAIKKGGADRIAIRDALEATTGFVGTAGVVNMTPQDHCGLNQDSFEMITIKDGKFALAGKITKK